MSVLVDDIWGNISDIINNAVAGLDFYKAINE